MCGRYALHSHPDVVALQFTLASAPEIEARYNICPSNEILIVREHAQRGRVCDQAPVGLVADAAPLCVLTHDQDLIGRTDVVARLDFGGGGKGELERHHVRVAMKRVTAAHAPKVTSRQ